MSRRAVSISLRDLRIAKLEKKMRFVPCSEELDAYINALSIYGDEKIPTSFQVALSECIKEKVFIVDTII